MNANSKSSHISSCAEMNRRDETESKCKADDGSKLDVKEAKRQARKKAAMERALQLSMEDNSKNISSSSNVELHQSHETKSQDRQDATVKIDANLGKRQNKESADSDLAPKRSMQGMTAN